MRRFAILFALPLLAGCSGGSIGNMLDFPGGASSQEVASAAPATPAPAAPAAAGAPNAFCMGVARGDAMGNDFDAATQARVAQRSYAQCVAIFGNAQ